MIRARPSGPSNSHGSPSARHWGSRSIAALFCTLIIGLTSGCTSGYEIPPTAATATPADFTGTHRTIIALKPFSNPVKSHVPWSDIGTGMSEALSRKLLNRGDFDVRIQTDLGKDVETALRLKGEERTQMLRKLGIDNPNIDFAVTGAVTDFHHTRELSGDLRSKGLFGIRQNQAVSAIFLNIVDLRSGLVRMSDHVIGTADAGRSRVDKEYDDIAFGSYLFWSTPLGKASSEAIDRTVETLVKLVPSSAVEIVATREGMSRTLRISGGKARDLKVGADYAVCTKTTLEAKPEPLLDGATGTPIKARILSVDGAEAKAWMLGEPASIADARILVLQPTSR